MRFVPLFLALCCSSAWAVDGDLPLEDSMNSLMILSQVSRLMLKKHNISRPFLDPVGPILPTENVLEDDMRLTVDQAKMILQTIEEEMGIARDSTIAKRVSTSSKKWTFPIKYAFDGTHSDAEKATIRQGLAMWSSTTCVSFQEFSSASAVANTPSITFNKGSGCWSYIGTISSKTQTISLGNGCVVPGISAHEVGHALGMYHEQMRNDRDSAIRVNLANCISGYESAFAKVSASDDNNYGAPYDFESIMHYDTLGFSNDYWGKKRVIEPVDIRYLTHMGNRDFLSFNDIKRINYHYNCIASSCGSTKLPQPCQNGGYQDPKNCVKCRCPNGWGGDFCTINAASKGATCGGVINLAACSQTTITSPNSPSSYPAGSSCSWVVEAPSGSGLVFGFEGQPKMPCNYADRCNDFVEVRTNSNDPTYNGFKFCSCGQASGRYSTNANKAAVYFAGYATSGASGFRLNVYATCPGTTASSLSTECVISNTGFDYAGSTVKASSGQSCSAWSGQSTYPAINFPDGTLMAAGSKCRNPDARSSPWCYTTNYQTIGSCSFPKCPTGAVTTTAAPATTTTTTRAASTTTRAPGSTTTTTRATTTTTTTRAATTTTQAATTTRAATQATPSPVKPSVGSTTCRTTVDGRNYVGSLSRTVRGYTCQRWDNQWPQSHGYTSANFPDSVSQAGNACRNPDPVKFPNGVWCFTNDPTVRTDYCNVPRCATGRKRTWIDKMLEEYSDLAAREMEDEEAGASFNDYVFE